MMNAFAETVVGEPLRHGNLSVFPLYSDASQRLDYVLAADGIADGTVVVEEVSEAGSVPTLAVTNKSERLVLFLEGEQLVGAKQNRIVNMSVLVAGHSKTTLSVSCVEQGRWQSTSKHFGASATYSPSKLRHALKASVTASINRGRGHASDQRQVWKHVAEYQRSHGGSSATGALEDTFEKHRGKLAELQKQFAYAEGTSGIAVALGTNIVSVDLFDRPATCGKVWDRLLTGVLLDSIDAQPDSDCPDAIELKHLLEEIASASWQPTAAVGEAEEFRAVTRRGVQASALFYARHLVHGSAVGAS